MIVKCRKTKSNPDKSRVPCQGLSCYVETLLALGTLHRPVTRPVSHTLRTLHLTPRMNNKYARKISLKHFFFCKIKDCVQGG